MSYTKTYNITGLRKTGSLDGLSDVVTRVFFSITGSQDGGPTGSVGDLELWFGTPTSGSFIDFDNLTESDIVNWITTEHPDDLFDPQIRDAIVSETQPLISGSSLPWE